MAERRSARPEGWAQIGVDRLTPDEAGPPGIVLAVWGPAGAPGRSVLAAALAAAAAARAASTTRAARGVRGTRAARGPALLIDADPYGGAQAALHRQLDDTSGLLAATRLAEAGTLDPAALCDATVTLPGGLRLLTGLSEPADWPRLRPESLAAVFETARRAAAITVVDCGFCLEEDEELSYDTSAPRRNAATIVAVTAADRLLAVGRADPVGAVRLRPALAALRTLRPEPVPVALRLTGTDATARAWAHRLGAELTGSGAVSRVHRWPHDPNAVTAQLTTGVPVTVASVASGASELGRAANRLLPLLTRGDIAARGAVDM